MIAVTLSGLLQSRDSLIGRGTDTKAAALQPGQHLAFYVFPQRPETCDRSGESRPVPLPSDGSLFLFPNITGYMCSSSPTPLRRVRPAKLFRPSASVQANSHATAETALRRPASWRVRESSRTRGMRFAIMCSD